MQSVRYWFRYYFVRKKAPLSWIFWGDILRRRSSWQGTHAISLAAANEPDAGISFSLGAPGENRIEIDIYDGNEKRIDTVYINLSYRSMQKVCKGFDKATAISRAQIRKESEKTDE